MNGLERRLTPRIEWLADIHFEPNNGGIVLDLSEGGLSFHAITTLFRGPIARSISRCRCTTSESKPVANWPGSTGRKRLEACDLPACPPRPANKFVIGQAKRHLRCRLTMRPRAPCRHCAHFRGDTGIQPESKAAPLEVASPGRKGLASWSRFSAGIGVGRSRFGPCRGGILVSQLSSAVWGVDHPVWRTGSRKTPSSAANGIASCAAGSCRRRLPHRLQARQFRSHNSPDRSYRNPPEMRHLHRPCQRRRKRSPNPWCQTPLGATLSVPLDPRRLQPTAPV